MQFLSIILYSNVHAFVIVPIIYYMHKIVLRSQSREKICHKNVNRLNVNRL